MLPLASMFNVVISTFLLLECGFVGFKKHLLHLDKPFYLVLLIACFVYLIWWAICFKILDDYVAENLPVEEMIDSSKRQREELAMMKQQFKEEDKT